MEMNTKNVFIFILILVFLLIIAVGISKLDNRADLPLNQNPNGTTTDQGQQNFEELNWERYENQEVGFAISYPFEMEVEVVDGGPGVFGQAVNFSMWGPTQIFGSEFFDGISVTIQKESMEDLGTSANVRNYAGLSHEHDRTMPVTDNITGIEEIDINEITGYTYTVISIGEHTHIYLPHSEENMILHIIYSAPDPNNIGFQKIVDDMLGTLTLL